MRLAARDLTRVGPLPPGEKLALALEIVASYARVRRSLGRTGLRETLAELRGNGAGAPGAGEPLAAGGHAPGAGEPRAAGGHAPGAGGSASPVAGARRLGRVVRRTLALLPGDTRCLSQSLVLTRLLAARGVESELVIGVVPGERFAAHAWLEHEGAALLPPGGGDFQELVKL